MLILSRKKDERVRIYKGDIKLCEIVVTKGGRISLGFEADPSIRIVRNEIDRQ